MSSTLPLQPWLAAFPPELVVPDWNPDDVPIPNLDELVTVDGAPVDRIYTEKQCRLLTEPLYSSWSGPPGEGRTFLALTNVGWFYQIGKPPLVPDVLFALDVVPAGDLHTKAGHSYYQWLIGKPPDAVFEFVSDKTGGEEHFKMEKYAQQGVLVYVIYDPENQLGGDRLRILLLQRKKYEPTDPAWLPDLGLGLKLWEGTFEKQFDTWLRWCDRDGVVIPTGAERALEAEEKIRRLEAHLRALGVDLAALDTPSSS